MGRPSSHKGAEGVFNPTIFKEKEPKEETKGGELKIALYHARI